MIFYMITSFEINNQELFMFFSSVRSTGGIVLYIPIIQRILCLSSYTHTNRHTHTHTQLGAGTAVAKFCTLKAISGN